MCIIFLDIALIGADVLTFGGYDKLTVSAENRGGFILNDMVFNRTGVLFAFVTFFRTLTPVRLQIWRPLVAAYDFQLVFDVRVVPGVNELNRRLEVRT